MRLRSDFRLDEQQDLLVGSFASFFETALPLDADRTFEPSDWQRFCGLGGHSIAVPAEYGGGGGSLVDAVLVGVEAGRVCAPIPFAEVNAIGLALHRVMPAALLDRLVGGEIFCPIAVGELDGLFLGDTATGTARHVLFGSVGEVLVVPSDDQLVFLEANEGGTTTTDKSNIARLPMGDVDLREATPIVRIPNDLYTTMWSFDLALLRSALVVGAAFSAFEATCAYVGTRVQFGQPISSFQAVRHRLADTYVALSGAAATLMKAASVRHDADRFRCMTLLGVEAATAAGELATVEANQLFGGYGFTTEYPTHVFVRYVKMLRLYLRAWSSRMTTQLDGFDWLHSGRAPLQRPEAMHA